MTKPLGPNGEYLEARIPNGGFPADVTAKVIFQEGFPAERFDFIFAELSREDAPVLGDKTDVDSAYRIFGSAVGEISAVYDVPPTL